jgi:Xaa-Pro dipeptidase
MVGGMILDIQYTRVPENEIRQRIQALQTVLKDRGLDGAIIVQNVDLYYFSGTMQVGQLFVPTQGEPLLMIRKSVDRATEDSPFQVEQLGSLKGLQQLLQTRFGTIGKIGLEYDVLPYSQVERLKLALPGTVFEDISGDIRQIRMIKSQYEIDCLHRAAKIQHEALQQAVQLIPKGIREIDLVAAIEHYIRTHGHIAVTRTRGFNQELVLGAVVSGPEAAIPSYFDGPAGGVGLSSAAPAGSGWSPVRPNEPILIDFCTCIDGYNFDQTRTAVWGDLDPELEDAFHFSREILREVERLAKPGVTPESLYIRALEMVEKKGLSAHFMGYGRNQAKFLGHGVGLEVDELPVLAKGFAMPLTPGMTIAIEPKFTFPGKGVVGVENTYLVTEDGLVSMSITPEDLIVIPI